jgi:type II secretion system protein G
MNPKGRKVVLAILLALCASTPAYADPVTDSAEPLVVASATVIIAISVEIYLTVLLLRLSKQNRKKVIAVFIGIQVLTLTLLFVTLPFLEKVIGWLAGVTVLESLIVVIEGALYYFYLKRGTQKRAFRKCLLASFVGNFSSLALGFALPLAYFSIVSRFEISPDNTLNGVEKLFVNDSINTPLEAYRIGIGHYPTTAEGLDALIHCPKGSEGKWRGPYLALDKVPLDPWGRPYQYRCPGVHNPQSYDIWSLGPSGVESESNLGNWKR